MNLNTPFSMLVVGPSGSGKSVFVNRLLQNSGLLFDKSYDKVIWCYGIWQKFYQELPYQMNDGLPSDELLNTGNFTLVVDDLMDEAQETVSAIFTKVSHHNNINCIFLTQNLFPKGRHSRNISLNAHYIVLMKNTRDKAQISHLARQVYPQNSKFLVDAYHDATLMPYSYLFLDFKPETDEKNRVRTGLFPSEEHFAYRQKI